MAHGLGLEGTGLPLNLFNTHPHCFVALLHFLIHRHSLALFPWHVFLYHFSQQLAFHHFPTGLLVLPKDTGLVVFVHGLQLTHWLYFVDFSVLHYSVTLFLVFSLLPALHGLPGPELLDHLHVALLHVDGVTEATLLLLHLQAGAGVHLHATIVYMRQGQQNQQRHCGSPC